MLTARRTDHVKTFLKAVLKLDMRHHGSRGALLRRWFQVAEHINPSRSSTNTNRSSATSKHSIKLLTERNHHLIADQTTVELGDNRVKQSDVGVTQIKPLLSVNPRHSRQSSCELCEIAKKSSSVLLRTRTVNDESKSGDDGDVDVANEGKTKIQEKSDKKGLEGEDKDLFCQVEFKGGELALWDMGNDINR
jgi:hypothetical protein